MPLWDTLSHHIGRKIGITILLVVFTVLGSFEWYQYTETKKYAEGELTVLADRIIARLGQNLELPLWEVDDTWVEKVVITEMEDTNVHAIFVNGEGGIAIGKSRDQQWRSMNSESIPSNAVISRKLTINRNGNKIGDVSLYVSRRFMYDSLEDEALNALSEALLLGIFLILFLRMILDKIIILPLSKILGSAQSYANGDYGHDITLQQSDEIGMLADELNIMKEKINQRESERDQALAMLEQDKERTKAQLDLTLANFDDERTLIKHGVEEFVRITQSDLGYLHFYDEEKESITLHTWSTGFDRTMSGADADSYPLNKTGEWTDAIRLKQPFFHITEDDQVHTPDAVLDGKTALSNHMSVPILSSSQVVGIAGVANRAAPYSEPDSEILSLYVNTLWYLVEKNRAYEELTELRHYLQNVFDSMPSVLIGVEPSGHITHWNKGAESFTGINSQEAQGKVVDKVLPLLSMRMKAVERAIKESQPQRMERVTHSESGESRYADIMIYPLVTNAHVGAVIRIDDVTERVRVEEMMVQTEKMMSVGGLAAGMAHEINNPLGGILQGQQNIRRRLSPELEKNLQIADEIGLDLKLVWDYMEQRQILHFLDEIAKAGERAGTIVENMLHFSRKGEVKLPVNVAGLLDEVLQLAAVDYDLKKKYDFRSIQIERHYAPELPPVSCIGSEIQQVLLNVLRNSAQAMQEMAGQEVPPRIIVSAKKEGGRIRIDISDNGPGMDEETRHRAFEPFYTTKPPGQGTGLGLSVSYFIITETHGGEILLESEVGKGTKLSILLPIE